jgi:hypothetical protein
LRGELVAAAYVSLWKDLGAKELRKAARDVNFGESSSSGRVSVEISRTWSRSLDREKDPGKFCAFALLSLFSSSSDSSAFSVPPFPSDRNLAIFVHGLLRYARN